MRKLLIKVVGYLERLTGKLNSMMSILEYNLTFPVRARSYRWMKKNYKKLLEKYGECTLVIHDREVVGGYRRVVVREQHDVSRHHIRGIRALREGIR